MSTSTYVYGALEQVKIIGGNKSATFKHSHDGVLPKVDAPSNEVRSALLKAKACYDAMYAAKSCPLANNCIVQSVKMEMNVCQREIHELNRQLLRCLVNELKSCKDMCCEEVLEEEIQNLHEEMKSSGVSDDEVANLRKEIQKLKDRCDCKDEEIANIKKIVATIIQRNSELNSEAQVDLDYYEPAAAQIAQDISRWQSLYNKPATDEN
jgi:predicted RNase H-like nuclease (RuvC/YqgF family)